MGEELYDWSGLTREESALDLLGHLVRWGLRGPNMPTKKYRAIALTDGIEVGDLKAVSMGDGTRLMFKARIIGENSPHSHIPDPCDPAYFSDSDYVYKLISLHTWFVSARANNRVSAVTRGDRIMVELESRGSKKNRRHNTKYGRYLALLSVEDPSPQASERCASLIKLFGQITHTPLTQRKMGNPTAPLAPPPGGNLPPPSPTHGRVEHVDFFLKMRALLPLDKYSDEFIYGMMGNVAHESGFDAGISGDPMCSNPQRLIGPATGVGTRGHTGNTNYAAHGLFQMNTCRSDAMGTQMLEYYGFKGAQQQGPADAQARYALLTNGDKQIEFMAWRLQKLGGTFTNTGAAAITEYTKWFLYEIENPASPESSRGSRTSHARGYASSITALMAAAQEDKPTACKGPATGGVQGTDYEWVSSPLANAWKCIT